jgi:hypothetical protein
MLRLCRRHYSRLAWAIPPGGDLFGPPLGRISSVVHCQRLRKGEFMPTTLYGSVYRCSSDGPNYIKKGERRG